eukprot:TRINITY_DN12380_c0_g1_i1.p2 TRINITY_DN12380_c0_g1~~TRINITY_DN12380_c0_g1_i1.p2  ORF type:complete len:284 (+),score=31.43 TRINITY_DN12380_c0_g1_i1:114-965(+)
MAEADRFDPELLRNLVASLNDPSLHEIAAVFCHACIVHHGWRHHDDVDTSEAHPALGANFKTAEGFQATYVKDETEALLKAIPMDELLLVHFQMNDQDVKLVEIDVHRLLNSGANLNNADLLFRLDTFNIACAVAQQLGLKATSSSPAQKQSQQTAQRHQPDAASSKPARPARSEDNRPSRLMDSRQSARNPYAIGEGDLDPLRVGPMAGGGMYVGPNHPMFAGRGGIGGMNPMGGPGVPPGARYDPVTPFGGLGGRGRGRGRGFGEPNPDHLRPPGGFDPFM